MIALKSRSGRLQAIESGRQGRALIATMALVAVLLTTAVVEAASEVGEAMVQSQLLAQHVVTAPPSSGSVPSALLKYMQKPVVGRQAVANARAAVKAKKKKSEKKKSDPKAALASRATQELELLPSERTPTVIETPATVHTQLVKDERPPERSSLELGFSAQLFRPEGKARVIGFEPYELSSLGEQPMPALELGWQPLALEDYPSVLLGGFVSLGYAQHTVELRGPTGYSLDQAKLHTTKLQAGLSVSTTLATESRWSVRFKAGAGRVDMIQSSKTPDANQSGYLFFGSAGAFVENQTWDRVGLYAGYENRFVLSKSDELLGLPQHNLLIGAWGSFQ